MSGTARPVRTRTVPPLSRLILHSALRRPLYWILVLMMRIPPVFPHSWRERESGAYGSTVGLICLEPRGRYRDVWNCEADTVCTVPLLGSTFISKLCDIRTTNTNVHLEHKSLKAE